MSSTIPDRAYPPLIAGLLRPDAYPHPAASLRIAETHISWVILAGEFAYKIKKPVDFGFLDFTTLDRRRFYCEEELRLNRRYAEGLYLAVLPVVGSPDHPRMGGIGTALDYAVQMRRFDEALLFDRLAPRHRLLPEHMDLLAETLAAFHATIGRAAPEDAHGLPEHQRHAAELNFSKVRPLLDDPQDTARLDALLTWTRAEYSRREATMCRRKRDGFIRECHGDLHLGNIVLIEGRPTLFDGIEFNEDLRWIDVVSELAFLAMDLEVNGAKGLAYRLLNRYLAFAGDYAGLALFDYYRLYRAVVRAKIAQLTRSQSEEPAARAELLARCRRYIDYGLELIRPRRPRLFITHGLSGSGKSYLAARLAERLPAIHLRSDVERKRLAGLAAEARTGSAPAGGIYGKEMTERTYGRLADIAEGLVEAGQSVIVDATFLKREHRTRLQQAAERRSADFLVLDCQAPIATFRERIRSRALAATDPSEADSSVLDYQIGQQEPLDEGERSRALAVDTGGEVAVEDLMRKIVGPAD